MSNLPRVPPASVDYSKLLPLGVKAQSKMRKFQPNNGSSSSIYTAPGTLLPTEVIKMTL